MSELVAWLCSNLNNNQSNYLIYLMIERLLYSLLIRHCSLGLVILDYHCQLIVLTPSFLYRNKEYYYEIC